MGNVYLIYVVFFSIVGFIAYHKMFDIIYFDLGRGILKEIIGSIIFGLIMTAITIKFWLVSVIVIVIVGLVMVGKAKSSTGKILVISGFGLIAVMTMVAGINLNRDLKNDKENDTSEQQYSKGYDSEDEQDSVSTYDYIEEDYSSNNTTNTMEEITSETTTEITTEIITEVTTETITELTTEVISDVSTEKENEVVKGKKYEPVDDEEKSIDRQESSFFLPDSSSEYLTYDDIKDFSQSDLMYARNEIYARNGYIFNDSELASYFKSQSWYIPKYTSDQFSDDMLNEIEKANIRLIKSYEE